MGRAFVCNQIPGREIHCPVLPTGDLGSSLREAAARLAAGTVRPRSEDVGVRALKGPWDFSAPGSRRSFSTLASLPVSFQETREAATSKEGRKNPPRAALVKGRWGAGDSKGEGCGSEARRQSLPLRVQQGHLLPGEPTQPLPTWRTKGLGSTVGVGEQRWREAGRQAVGVGEGACLHFLSGPNDGKLHAASASLRLLLNPGGLGFLT